MIILNTKLKLNKRILDRKVSLDRNQYSLKIISIFFVLISNLRQAKDSLDLSLTHYLENKNLEIYFFSNDGGFNIRNTFWVSNIYYSKEFDLIKNLYFPEYEGIYLFYNWVKFLIDNNLAKIDREIFKKFEHIYLNYVNKGLIDESKGLEHIYTEDEFKKLEWRGN